MIGGKELAPAVGGRISLIDRLKNEQKALSDRLIEVDHAIETLERNPAVAEVVNMISKLYPY